MSIMLAQTGFIPALDGLLFIGLQFLEILVSMIIYQFGHLWPAARLSLLILCVIYAIGWVLSNLEGIATGMEHLAGRLRSFSKALFGIPNHLLELGKAKLISTIEAVLRWLKK